MRRIDKQDVFDWLEDQDAPQAEAALSLIEAIEARENTVIGMCLARRPHTEIRDYLLNVGDSR